METGASAAEPIVSTAAAQFLEHDTFCPLIQKQILGSCILPTRHSSALMRPKLQLLCAALALSPRTAFPDGASVTLNNTVEAVMGLLQSAIAELSTRSNLAPSASTPSHNAPSTAIILDIVSSIYWLLQSLQSLIALPCADEGL